MKRCILFILLLPLLSCNSTKSKTQNKEETNSYGKLTEISFENEIHDFGKLKSGEVVVFTFVYKNTGNSDLLINDVKADCGCVNTSYTNKPVIPGKTGEIEVQFDSSGLFGNQFKTIIVEANVPETKHLAIFAKVNNDQLKITY